MQQYEAHTQARAREQQPPQAVSSAGQAAAAAATAEAAEPAEEAAAAAAEAAEGPHAERRSPRRGEAKTAPTSTRAFAHQFVLNERGFHEQQQKRPMEYSKYARMHSAEPPYVLPQQPQQPKQQPTKPNHPLPSQNGEGSLRGSFFSDFAKKQEAILRAHFTSVYEAKPQKSQLKTGPSVYEAKHKIST